MTEQEYMDLACEEAKIAASMDEVPIGAVVVDVKSGEVVAKAHNLCEHQGMATHHAEMLAMQQACEKLGTNRLRGMDLYVTIEPCTMCAGAISFMRIRHLYIGAEDKKGGAVINGVCFFSSPTCHHRPEVSVGIRKEECASLMKDFFRQKRQKSTSSN